MPQSPVSARINICMTALRSPRLVGATSEDRGRQASTREATLLDLIRHQSSIGGIEAVARIARDLAPSIDLRGLKQSLDAMDQVPAAQRLGYVFDHLGLKKPAQQVEAWLEGRRTLLQPLELKLPIDETGPDVDRRWNIRYDARRLSWFEELA